MNKEYQCVIFKFLFRFVTFPCSKKQKIERFQLFLFQGSFTIKSRDAAGLSVAHSFAKHQHTATRYSKKYSVRYNRLYDIDSPFLLDFQSPRRY